MIPAHACNPQSCRMSLKWWGHYVQRLVERQSSLSQLLPKSYLSALLRSWRPALKFDCINRIESTAWPAYLGNMLQRFDGLNVSQRGMHQTIARTPPGPRKPSL